MLRASRSRFGLDQDGQRKKQEVSNSFPPCPFSRLSDQVRPDGWAAYYSTVGSVPEGEHVEPSTWRCARSESPHVSSLALPVIVTQLPP